MAGRVDSAVGATADPTAVRFALEALHAALRALRTSWLSVTAGRLRQLLVGIERIVENTAAQQYSAVW